MKRTLLSLAAAGLLAFGANAAYAAPLGTLPGAVSSDRIVIEVNGKPAAKKKAVVKKRVVAKKRVYVKKPVYKKKRVYVKRPVAKAYAHSRWYALKKMFHCPTFRR